MKVTYTGKQHDLSPIHEKKLNAKFAKIAKMLDKREGEREAHVILTNERHLHHAEITVNFYDHPLVGVGSDGDLFTALTSAVDKLEKQLLRTREKWRDQKRGTESIRSAWSEEEEEEAGVPPAPARGVAAEVEDDGGSQHRVFRVNNHGRKPMTLEEAILEMQGRDYLAFRNAETDRVSVLVRRRDGDFDLIEA
jgi:putative sigma-54 modulation protein